MSFLLSWVYRVILYLLSGQVDILRPDLTTSQFLHNFRNCGLPLKFRIICAVLRCFSRLCVVPSFRYHLEWDNVIPGINFYWWLVLFVLLKLSKSNFACVCDCWLSNYFWNSQQKACQFFLFPSDKCEYHCCAGPINAFCIMAIRFIIHGSWYVETICSGSAVIAILLW